MSRITEADNQKKIKANDKNKKTNSTFYYPSVKGIKNPDSKWKLGRGSKISNCKQFKTKTKL
jgi:hypothetical protein